MHRETSQLLQSLLIAEIAGMHSLGWILLSCNKTGIDQFCLLLECYIGLSKLKIFLESLDRPLFTKMDNLAQMAVYRSS